MSHSYRNPDQSVALKETYRRARETIEDIGDKIDSFQEQEPSNERIFAEIKQDYPDAADEDMSRLFSEKRKEIRERPQRLEDALRGIGYEKTIIQKNDAQRIAYVRCDDNMMDVLTDTNLLYGRGICLYRAPGMSIEDFLENIKEKQFDKKRAAYVASYFLSSLTITGLGMGMDSRLLAIIGAMLSLGPIVLFAMSDPDDEPFYQYSPYSKPISAGKQALFDACKPTEGHQRIMDVLEIHVETEERGFEEEPIEAVQRKTTRK